MSVLEKELVGFFVREKNCAIILDAWQVENIEEYERYKKMYLKQD